MDKCNGYHDPHDEECPHLKRVERDLGELHRMAPGERMEVARTRAMLLIALKLDELVGVCDAIVQELSVFNEDEREEF